MSDLDLTAKIADAMADHDRAADPSMMLDRMSYLALATVAERELCDELARLRAENEVLRSLVGATHGR